MSFLANLRQQANTDKAMQLFYVLTIDPLTKIARLHLLLGDASQSQPSANCKSYFIQQQHLNHPPEFIQNDDVAILQTLLKTDADWNQHASGALIAESTWAFLQQLAATDRFFLEPQPGSWQKLSSGESQPAALQWQIDSTGEQSLHWKLTEENSRIFFIQDNTFTQPYAITQQKISECHTGLNEEKNALITKHGKIAAYEVDYFLLKNQEQWQDLNLPLPRTLEEQSISGDLVAILSCHTVHAPSEVHSQRDELHLSFGLQTENFCINLTECSDTEVWDGNALTTVNHDKQAQATLHASIAEHLQEFSARQQVGEDLPSVWYSRSCEQWQWLFTEERDKLLSLNIHFNIMPNFRQHYVTAEKWDIGLKENEDDSVDINIEITVANEKISLKKLLDQLHELNEKAISNRSKTHQQFQLDDGRLLLIPLQQFNGIMEELADLAQQSESGFCLSKHESHRLAGLHQHMPENSDWHGDRQKLENAIELHDSPLFLENSLENVQADLRPYQWLGVCWMQHITQRNINGLLADDMGLGKTLQTLAHLSFEHQHGRLQDPALIIVPTSLLHNWAREVEKFTPHLKHKIIHGSQRHQWWDSIADFNIIISSYPLISNDLSNWQAQKLSWIILDEAQTIKNPRTRVSQAVREIPCDRKMCLSGTPVENHLGELWSILDFLMPSCLGSAKHFRNHFQKAIENDGNERRFQVLLDRIGPFMLRRSKDQIAEDLPPKTEIIQTIPLDDDQAALYQQLKTNTWNEMQNQMDQQDSPQQGHIIVLNALMKLRQACCDPALLGETDISSAKRLHCLEMLEELESENRSILVFSQFTSMLQILADSLQEMDIPYLMLTGQTKNRQKLVDQFQNGEAPIFLISLKAGGTGLNLTRADTIIHYDPWWNQAAEQQATDRAHRIGQEKPVFVYKLIAENTIEEKIAQMQQRKMVLSHHVNQQAQLSGENFALDLEEMLNLWQDDNAI
ncbi:ATP-dependent RNA helicase DbpA [Thalassocella blandensis]|nr:ATP-dependent RNA helicase DbpA [Thalassocella blandensis]